MKSYKYIPCVGLLILSLSFSVFPKTGTISTTKTGTISTTKTGTISTTTVGTISTTRTGTISTTRTSLQVVMESVISGKDALNLFSSLLTAW